MSAPGKIVVIGGGLAGITAAIALSEIGADVTLAEARPRLGGATTSFSRGGLMVDNGQHVFLRCCVAYRGLLARLGMTGAVSLQDRFDVTVLAPGGRAQLRRTALPGPLHMGQALMGYRFLSRAQRLRVARAALAMAALNPAKPELDRQRLGDFLAAHGQDERTRRLLWDLFTVSALNVNGDDANLSLAATVVKTALLGARDAADIGVPSVPLGVLHGQAAGALLARLGAQVRLSAKVAAIEVLPGGPGPRFRVRLAGRRGGDGPPVDGTAPDGNPLDGAARTVTPWTVPPRTMPPGMVRDWMVRLWTMRARSSRRMAWCWRCRRRSRPGWRPRARSARPRSARARCGSRRRRATGTARRASPARSSGRSWPPHRSSTCT